MAFFTTYVRKQKGPLGGMPVANVTADALHLNVCNGVSRECLGTISLNKLEMRDLYEQLRRVYAEDYAPGFDPNAARAKP